MLFNIKKHNIQFILGLFNLNYKKNIKIKLILTKKKYIFIYLDYLTTILSLIDMY